MDFRQKNSAYIFKNINLLFAIGVFTAAILLLLTKSDLITNYEVIFHTHEPQWTGNLFPS